MSRIHELVRASSCKRPVIVILWGPAQKDVKRGAGGETIWTDVTKAQWKVAVLDWDEPAWREEVRLHTETEKVDGVECHFGRFPNQSSLEGRTLDYRAGEFVIA